MKIAIVGATGLVGSVMLKVLEERNFPCTELLLAASPKSVGKTLRFHDKEVKIISVEDAIAQKPQIALFSAGSAASLKYAPLFAENGSYVIDNSSAWRMDADKKLIVPEINASALTRSDLIIANPNCSTIQMLIALAPLHKKYGLKRIIVSTYQSVTGTGVKAVEQMENERAGKVGEMAYKYPIDKNCIPQIDVFLDNGYTKEEMKMLNETRKILNDNSINVSATCVRIPVIGGHSESINVELHQDFEINELKALLNNTSGLTLLDDPAQQLYPMPLIHAHNSDQVYVGRLRRDESQPNTVNMWVVADNLRKGAATNAVQIAEYITRNIL